ncbi:prolipoprotein diacylglyceryl transferase [Verrucomicrobiaceae bacterium R5-34]|uniref:Prolipoprotein diacylglyceryl transferase n=1 Tax=Oceaniferula flava TaxID=2800421 RepID=A0AAE2S9K8_9BACT|nr:prolipoprotein diacylglyceryl transferase family protein [Oceaniferula flavus]MBK1829690.1 prolipoprotein diacylglyceryl transferase [Verrucomicrobiaceae bacterium R5-34]MBK1853880.1 prolipoprotein diacylglyceryl transferase [Oceaniferula flavus]MBM1135186.1 prolipoprotein diacylglyceryl transferase [Oceaniferula flavus]
MPEILQNTSLSWYSLTMLAAILLSAFYWLQMSRDDALLPKVYFCALACAFVGAKLAYLVSEGWMHTGDDRWLHWLSGKSITGALLGGYLGVEVFKKWFGYRKITGDRFALIVPISIILGRFGCLSQGCCPGIACQLPAGINRWPAVPMEIAFNVAAILVFIWLRRRRSQQWQHFHLYLMAYGLFRFFHEFLRATPKPFAGMSGYQLIALAIALLGGVAYVRRKRTLRQDVKCSQPPASD